MYNIYTTITADCCRGVVLSVLSDILPIGHLCPSGISAQPRVTVFGLSPVNSDAVLNQHGNRSAAETYFPQRNSYAALAVASGNSCRRTFRTQHVSKSLRVVPARHRRWQMMSSQVSFDNLGQTIQFRRRPI